MGFLTIAKVRHPTHPNLYIGVGEIGELAHPKTPHFGEIGELPRQFFLGTNKPCIPGEASTKATAWLLTQRA